MSFSFTTNLMETPNTRKSIKRPDICSKVTPVSLFHLASKTRAMIKKRKIKMVATTRSTMSSAGKIKLRSF